MLNQDFHGKLPSTHPMEHHSIFLVGLGGGGGGRGAEGFLKAKFLKESVIQKLFFKKNDQRDGEGECKLDCEQSLFCSKICGAEVAEHESRASSKPQESCVAGDERKERLQWFHTTIVKLFDSSCLSQLRLFFNAIPRYLVLLFHAFA